MVTTCGDKRQLLGIYRPDDCGLCWYLSCNKEEMVFMSFLVQIREFEVTAWFKSQLYQ